jgi:hypothetical protein
MISVSESTCELAWLVAAEHLATAHDHTEYNLVVEIKSPTAHDDSDHRVRAIVDTFLRHHDANPVSTVAGTIFPTAQYIDHGTPGVYQVYPDEVYPEILGSNDWGRYAHRLVRWPPKSKTPINQLQIVVDKIAAQLANRQRMRACYDLSLTDSGIDLPLYDPVVDRKRIRNGPCLSHVTLKLGPTDTLYLTALYRSHSYVARALGNFLGLASLQAFVCDQTGLSPGPLMCVSSYARLETDDGWPLREALNLVLAARAAVTAAAPE